MLANKGAHSTKPVILLAIIQMSPSYVGPRVVRMIVL